MTSGLLITLAPGPKCAAKRRRGSMMVSDDPIVPCHEIGNAVDNLNAINTLKGLTLEEIREVVRKEAKRLHVVLNILRAEEHKRRERAKVGQVVPEKGNRIPL
jgi:hypothetical protein